MGRLSSDSLTQFAGGLRSRLLSRRVFAGTATGAVVASIGGGRIASGQSQGSQEIVPVTDRENRYFAETGHNLKNPFLGVWERNGGEDIFGQPISEERFDSDSGAVLQSFTGITLVYDPTLQSPWDVQGQHLGSQIHADQAPRSARTRVNGCARGASTCTHFPESGHTISGRMATFWNEHGGLAILGYPVSEAFEDEETGNTVQVFEKAVVEAGGGSHISLRPMGEAVAEAKGLLSDLAFLPAPPTGGTTFLVSASDGLRVRLGPSLDADVQVVVPDNAEFISAPGTHRDWVPGYVDGYSGWVSADYIKEPPALPQRSLADWNASVWQGAALSETNVREQPSTKAKIVDEMVYGDPLEVSAWVKGEEVFEGADLWAQIGQNRYIYARNVGRNAPVAPPPIPPDAPASGKWLDVNLTQQLIIAYDGRNPVRAMVMTSGMAGWETPPGFYFINHRVANETMTSGAIGAESFYKLEDVLFTQYFTDRGHAIHFAWWRTPETIGRPGSHGCLNLLLDDSRFVWDWATIGTPLSVHK
jgi:hypothetical protein